MILYHAISTYHLLNFMAYRMSLHANTQGILITADFMLDRYPHLMEMEGKIFDKIYVFKNSDFMRKNSDIIKNTDVVYNAFLKDHKIKLDDFSEIIVGCAHHFFGIYLINNDIKFTFLEDGSGLLSRPNIVESIEEKLNPDKHNICLEMGLYNGDNENITKKICNFRSQIDGFIDEKAVHFDVLETLSSIEQNALDQILSFFRLDKYEAKPDSALLLTQHFANLNTMTFEQQKELYRLFVDYFLPELNKLLIKPHPDDLMYYEFLFPRAKVIKEKFPSELLPFVFSIKPRTIATVTSTAVKNLEDFFEKKLEFSSFFESNYLATHSYYTIMRIISKLNKNDKCYEIGSDKNMLENIISVEKIDSELVTLSEFKVEKNSITIVDDINFLFSDMEVYKKTQTLLDELDDESVVIFINSKKNYIFYNYPEKDLLKFIVPVEIKVCDLEENDEVYSDVVYFYSKSRELRDMINNMEVSKKLENSKLILNKRQLTEDQIRIKVLEGILDATEKRLNHYIELESTLRNELQSLKR